MSYVEHWRRKRINHVLPQRMYHAMVLLTLKNVKTEEVLEVLRHRFSKSGIDEKRSLKVLN
ncbi:hypothetical protein Ddye_030438 [Dipteronia dyeriana]|uniref:Uncharacterized protein n=1 Tax=Dipteronia dyeriana TaxID=168575 RepID=A0AAD9TH33_9ROSI|nr:hypothetical protein Ddye_030438 [Dipteronia dyeriana]